MLLNRGIVAAPPARTLLLDLARELHARGIPAPRLESALERAGRALGVDVQVLATPTSVQLAARNSGEPRELGGLVRAEAGEVDLGRIAALDELLDRITEGSLYPAAAASELRGIAAQAAAWPTSAVPAAYALISITAARFLGGGLAELGVAGVLGLAIGVASAVSLRVELRRVFHPVAALLAALVPGALAASGAPLAVDIVTLAGLIALVPGFTLTVAMCELAVGHLVAGMARLAGAGVTFLSIGLGVGLGSRAFGAVDVVRGMPMVPAALPAWTELAALAATPLAFAVLFQARRRDLGWILLAGVLGFWGARVGTEHFGPALGVCAGAFVVGCASNTIARLTRRPAYVMQVPGIMLLVPGSIGYASVSSFLASDVLTGVEAVFRVLMVGSSLASGLLLANVLVAPRRDL